MSLHGLKAVCDVKRDAQLSKRERQGPSHAQQPQLYELELAPFSPFCESFISHHAFLASLYV